MLAGCRRRGGFACSFGDWNADYGGIDDGWVGYYYSFELGWGDLPAADFDQVLELGVSEAVHMI